MVRYLGTYSLRYSVNIKMACCKGYLSLVRFWRMITHGFCLAHFYLDILPPNKTFTVDSFVLPGSGCEILTVSYPDSSRDAVSVMTFYPIGEQLCSYFNISTQIYNVDAVTDLSFINSLFFSVNNVRNVIHESKCSSSTAVLSDALYSVRFPWHTYLQLNIHISISPSLKHCAQSEMYVILHRHYDVNVRYIYAFNNSEGVIDLWKVEQNIFEWTIWDSADVNRDTHPYVMDLYIFVKSQNRSMLQRQNITYCNQTMHVRYHHDEVPYDIVTISSIQNMTTPRFAEYSKDMHCLLHTCYFLYDFEATLSWNSARMLCQQMNMQLLIMNSDIKAQFIQSIIHGYLKSYVARNTILFLNMKQTNTVCTITIVNEYLYACPFCVYIY